MALANALAFEGPKLGLRIGAVIVEHGLQEVTKTVARETAVALADLGFDPVRVVPVVVTGEGGPEAAARSARYQAIDEVAAELDARYVLLAHNKNDQAESVLLGLARGSGARSLSGMAELTGRYLRPLLQVLRETTVAACEDAGIKFWSDPHNEDEQFTRVRVRRNLLPIMEEELGPGIVDALSRTSDQLREDADVLEQLAEQSYAKVFKPTPRSLQAQVSSLLALQPAIRYRVYRMAGNVFESHLHRSHVLEIDRLLTDWHGQKPLTLPGVRVERTGEIISFNSTKNLKPGAC
jgi:tRNA(Ile)-lysidine synthase